MYIYIECKRYLGENLLLITTIVTHNKITTCTLTRTAFATPFGIGRTNYKKFSEEFYVEDTLQKYIGSGGIIHEGLVRSPPLRGHA